VEAFHIPIRQANPNSLERPLKNRRARGPS